MNTVTVEFCGVCTHVSRQYLPELPVPHRVVLVNASGATYINTIEIPRHTACLTLPDRVDPIPLNGVHLWLEIESATPPPLTEDLGALPCLMDMMAGLQPLSHPSHRMVLEKHAVEVACHFDISFGTVTSAIHREGAAYATLAAESEATFVLYAKAFPNVTLPEALAHPIRLPPNAHLEVANLDQEPERKSLADFLLHYRIAHQMPAVPQVPQVPPPAALHQASSRPAHSRPGTIGAGCSNSNYP